MNSSRNEAPPNHSRDSRRKSYEKLRIKSTKGMVKLQRGRGDMVKNGQKLEQNKSLFKKLSKILP